jgi:trk system potassium uptake protein TrkH
MARRYFTKADAFTIFHFLGILMQGIGIVLLLPVIVALIYGEFEYILPLMAPALCSIALGIALHKNFKKYANLKLKHGMFISSFAWLWATLIGAVIMMACLHIHFVDALFENMSAWTGSGMTFFVNVEVLPYSILFLRSLEQWVGGLGVVIIFIGILIRSGTAAARLYKSEAREEKIKPSIANTLKKTLEIYLIYTGFGIALYILAGLPVFDAVNLAFTSISTGGMSIKNLNVGFYQNNIIYVITMFLMILGAVSFNVHYKVIKTKGKSIFKDIQFRVMASFIIFFSIVIFLTNSGIVPMDILFHVVSAVTTTGSNISTAQTISTWHGSTLIILMALMVIGSSAGSTGGGLKIVRFITVLKGINHTISSIVSPEGRVIPTKIAGKKLTEREVREAGAYISIYFIFLVFGWVILCFYGLDPLNALFDVVSIISNNGLSTGIVWGGLPMIPKITLIFLMWLGRLEIIPVLVVFRTFIELASPRKVKKNLINRTQKQDF